MMPEREPVLRPMAGRVISREETGKNVPSSRFQALIY